MGVALKERERERDLSIVRELVRSTVKPLVSKGLVLRCYIVLPSLKSLPAPMAAAGTSQPLPPLADRVVLHHLLVRSPFTPGRVYLNEVILAAEFLL